MAYNFSVKLRQLFKDLFIGKRKLSKKDLWRERRRVCAAAGIHPTDIKNFWEGIEELRWKICIDCGASLGRLETKIGKTLKTGYGLCKKCNPHSTRPF